jgi:ATP-dependent RNA helicase DDX5/DBP2
MQNGGNYRSSNGSSGYQSQNRGGYGGGFDSQGFGGKRDMSRNGETLRPVNFDNIAPFRKDFYQPAASVGMRSSEEIQAINAKFEISVAGRESQKYPPISTFAEAGLPDFVLNEMSRQGFTHPTGIQAAAFPVVLSGRNLVGIAGKSFIKN